MINLRTSNKKSIAVYNLERECWESFMEPEANKVFIIDDDIAFCEAIAEYLADDHFLCDVCNIDSSK